MIRRVDRNSAFTIVELMVVIIIIVIILGVTVPLFNLFFRGNSLRNGATLVSSALAQARQLASNKPITYFVVFENKSDGGVISIYEDTNKNRSYDVGTDTSVADANYTMPKWVKFSDKSGSGTPGVFLSWIGVNPQGYLDFPSEFTEVKREDFDTWAANNDAVNMKGDIVLEEVRQLYKMYISLDKLSGKVRKSYLFTQ